MKKSPSSIRPKQVASESVKHRTARRRPKAFGISKVAALILVAGALALASPLYAQRGGGGGASAGGGGSHGGGGSAGGGGWSGGGGSHSSGGGGSTNHSSGGGSHGPSGAARASGGSRGSSSGGRPGSLAGTGSAGNSTHRSGFSAAVRRFFGLPEGRSSDKLLAGNAAFSPEKLPPAISRVRLPVATPGLSIAKPIAAITAPPRPIPPHPRRVLPYPPYGYCYGCDLGFGLGFGFDLGFGLFDFGYTNWYPGPWRQQTASADMLLYLIDGSALEAADYWVNGDTLHYLTDDGSERTIAVKDLDLQRTTEANQRLGLKFTLDRTQRGAPFAKARP